MLIVFLVKFYWSTKCRSLGNTALGSMPGLLKSREMVMGVQGVGSTHSYLRTSICSVQHKPELTHKEEGNKHLCYNRLCTYSILITARRNRCCVSHFIAKDINKGTAG